MSDLLTPGSAGDLAARAKDASARQAADIAESTATYVRNVAIVGGIFFAASLALAVYYSKRS